MPTEPIILLAHPSQMIKPAEWCVATSTCVELFELARSHAFQEQRLVLDIWAFLSIDVRYAFDLMRAICSNRTSAFRDAG